MFRRTHRIIFIALASLVMGYGPHALMAQDQPYAPVIDPTNFVTQVDNPYFPLTPGTTFIYQGKTQDGDERIEVSVLPATEPILGVTSTVVRDTVWVDGKLLEDTIDWYAQDKTGNVWYMGEATKEYSSSPTVSTAGTWKAGVDGAQPGILMKANPTPGDPYRQEYLAGSAEDIAQILSSSESASVPYGSYDHLLMTKEWTPLEPGVAEHKYYAEGVGLVQETMVQGGTEQVQLVDIVKRELTAGGNANESEDTDEALNGTPVIAAGDALKAAEANQGTGVAYGVELEYTNVGWIYVVEIGSNQVKVDAFTGEVLGVEEK